MVIGDKDAKDLSQRRGGSRSPLHGAEGAQESLQIQEPLDNFADEGVRDSE